MTPDSPEQKLIAALENIISGSSIYPFTLKEEAGKALPLARALISELAELRENADENWLKILEKYESLIGRQYKKDKEIYYFFGLVHADDDYYYGMSCQGKLTLLSCVGDIESFGYELIAHKE